MLHEPFVPFGPEVPSNTAQGIPEKAPWWGFVSEFLTLFNEVWSRYCRHGHVKGFNYG